MVKAKSSRNPRTSFIITIRISNDSVDSRDTILAALQPEFASIDSKRLKLHSTSSQNDLVFRFVAKDVTALRAATTSLMRLYLVAEEARQFTVKKNG
jgi:tRNA threonylcarbamoyladenosine modification (KEOPS) complex  Pcc1 subunit